MKKSEITKQRILKTAEKEFSDKGFYGARVDTIAGLAKVNKRMIYAYFKSKENLYMAVLETVYSRLSECEERLLSTSENAEEKVREIILMYFDFLSRNPSFVKLVMWENLMGTDHIENSSTLLHREPVLKAAGTFLCNGMRDGVFRSDLDADQTVMSMNTFCFSYFSNINTMSFITHKNLEDIDEVRKRAEHISNVIVKYIKA